MSIPYPSDYVEPPPEPDLGKCACGDEAYRKCTKCQEPICPECSCEYSGGEYCDPCSWTVKLYDTAFADKTLHLASIREAEDEMRLTLAVYDSVGEASRDAAFWFVAVKMAGLSPIKIAAALDEMLRERARIKARREKGARRG